MSYRRQNSPAVRFFFARIFPLIFILTAIWMFYDGTLLFGFLCLGLGTALAVFLPKATTTQIAPGDLASDYDGYDDGGDSGDSGDSGGGDGGGNGGGGD